MAIRTAWVIGSVKNGTFQYKLNGAGVATMFSGSRYLQHASTGLSIVKGLQASLLGEGVDDLVVRITRARKVVISASEPFDINWDDFFLGGLLGFTANCVGGMSYTAQQISPLLFSPGKPLLSEMSPAGTYGLKRPLAYYTMSPTDGSTFVVTHGYRIDQRFSATHVDIERVYTKLQLGGEWVKWFDEVPAKGYQFHVYPEVLEEDTTTTATLGAGLGPYGWVPNGRAPAWDYKRARGFEWTDFLADVSLVCRDVPEYGT